MVTCSLRLSYVIAVLALGYSARSQTNFTRIAGGSWSTATSWSPVGVPGPADSATISGAFDLNLDTSATVSNLTVSLGANTLFSDGTRVLTVLYSGNWSGGTISNIRFKLEPSCTFTFGGGSKTLFTTPFTNAGTINWTSGQLNLENNTTFYNQPGALFDVQFDGTLIQNSGGTSVFRNDGTYRKSAGANTNTIQIVRFINTGTASVSTGVIRFGTTAVTATGVGNTFLAENGTSMVFNQANNFTNSSFSGPGFKYHLATGIGEAIVSGNITATNLVFTSGTYRANATLNGTLDWTGGTLTSQLTLAPGSTLKLSGNGSKSLANSGVITNLGSVIWTGGQFNLDNNATFNNQPGALFDAQFDGTMIQNVAGTSTFRNEGTYRKSGGSGTNNISIVSFVQLGNLEFLSGVIRIVGNHSVGGSSTLKTLIGGTTAGSQFGQLQVSGSVALAGTLSLGLTNGFVPTTNQTFQIISAASRSGVFVGAAGSALGNGLYFTPAYLANGVRLDVVDGTARLTNSAVVGGQFQLGLLGTVGGRYQIDASTNLANWTSISTNLIPGSGFTNFIDSDSAIFPRRFYRALFLP
jgi:hypothetical protein